MSSEPGIELVLGPRPAQADIRLADCESLEDFEDELRDRLGEGELVLDLHARPGMALTLPEAVRALVKLAGAGHVRCVVASLAARKAAERLVPAYVRPDRETRLGALRVVVKQGDIVRVAADAVVNASNVRLELGAGVSGAIRRAVASPEGLQAEMSARAPIEPGAVVATPSCGLRTADHILHVATASGGEDAVARGYGGVLELAESMGLASLALPALGAGTGGLTAGRSAQLLLASLTSRSETRSLRTLLCVLFDADSADAFAAALGCSDGASAGASPR